MSAPSLQDAIDQAGNAVDLIWKPSKVTWKVPVVQPEHVGWAEEQEAWRSGVALSDLSFHMSDTTIVGPDAKRLLSDVSANNIERFEIGQAKQFIPVAEDGNIITDGILLKESEERFVLSGVPASQSWVTYHAQKGGYDVEMATNADSAVRQGGDPWYFRFQIQGRYALDLVEKAFGGPLPETKFFHSQLVELDGRPVRALRHGMAGQAGYEFIGSYADYDAVKDALMGAGEAFGITHVGGMAYFTNGVESGWIPTPTPAVYTAPELEDYRRWQSAFSYEGKKPMHGSFYSPDIEDYYTSPWELGYGRSISFNHDFIGRDALLAAKDAPKRTRVTLEWNEEDVARVFGGDPGYFLSYGRYRIENAHGLAGVTFYSANIAPVGKILSLSLVDEFQAEPGSEVEIVLGEHPGRYAEPDADLGFDRIRATVQPSPYDEYARTKYRVNA
ncbi:aminomethyl transferase family protein [Demequina sp. SYSU T00192]|uniref:Aminomethyl transferase family protein n=1 Tax=Demequina litoralis TaxID=3051660 RepID=A0ABT8GAZ9_9MICO|nr:aminomethyl transferase family protein [Demequina sp. SYSU T00192]MDN4476310.1 aminomethyl transferase family protein [Demequina sp. SYSU T00192]